LDVVTSRWIGSIQPVVFAEIVERQVTGKREWSFGNDDDLEILRKPSSAAASKAASS
jgi:hypothetical protein